MHFISKILSMAHMKLILFRIRFLKNRSQANKIAYFKKINFFASILQKKKKTLKRNYLENYHLILPFLYLKNVYFLLNTIIQKIHDSPIRRQYTSTESFLYSKEKIFIKKWKLWTCWNFSFQWSLKNETLLVYTLWFIFSTVKNVILKWRCILAFWLSVTWVINCKIKCIWVWVYSQELWNFTWPRGIEEQKFMNLILQGSKLFLVCLKVEC